VKNENERVSHRREVVGKCSERNQGSAIEEEFWRRGIQDSERMVGCRRKEVRMRVVGEWLQGRKGGLRRPRIACGESKGGCRRRAREV